MPKSVGIENYNTNRENNTNTDVPLPTHTIKMLTS